MKATTHLFAIGILLAASVTSCAEPTIRIQPASLAVLLGSNATFRVTATGTPPLAYQWRFEDRDLTSATNSSLVVSNVTPADLGRYTVVVRDVSGETISLPAWLKLARWTQLVAFGSSSCMAQYSNGSSWVDYLAELLCLPTNGKRNYSQGGAGTSGVRSQINQYLSINSPGTNTLFAFLLGGVGINLWSQAPVQQVVSNYALNVSLVAQAGGRVFLLPTIVRLYLNPTLSGSAYLRSIDYLDLNVRMDQEIQKLKVEYGLTVFRFDFYDLGERVWATPKAYGFTNLTHAANACTSCDPNQYFWWDGEHFTTAAHFLIAQEMYGCMTAPSVIALETGSASGVRELRWQGGSPPYRVQHCEDLANGLWQSGEVICETNAQVAASAPHQFFRILNLGQ